MDSKAIEQYYLNQAIKGEGGGVFHGSYYQRGYGIRRIRHGYRISGLFTDLFRISMPLVKEVAKVAVNEAISSSIGLLGDVTSGRNFKASLKVS